MAFITAYLRNVSKHLNFILLAVALVFPALLQAADGDGLERLFATARDARSRWLTVRWREVCMDVLELLPVTRVGGTVRLPGSKSISNRTLLLAALAQGRSDRGEATRRRGSAGGRRTPRGSGSPPASRFLREPSPRCDLTVRPTRGVGGRAAGADSGCPGRARPTRRNARRRAVVTHVDRE